jgi:hypothetical protein
MATCISLGLVHFIPKWVEGDLTLYKSKSPQFHPTPLIWDETHKALRPCSFYPQTMGIEGDWKGLRRILTYRGFVPPQSSWFDKKRTGPKGGKIHLFFPLNFEAYDNRQL